MPSAKADIAAIVKAAFLAKDPKRAPKILEQVLNVDVLPQPVILNLIGL